VLKQSKAEYGRRQCLEHKKSTYNPYGIMGVHIGVNPAGDAGDVSPPIFWLVGTSAGMSPPIFRVAM